MATGARRLAIRGGVSIGAILAAAPVLAFGLDGSIPVIPVAGGAVIAGLGTFSAFCGIALLRMRRRAERERLALQDEVRQLSNRLQRAEVLNRLEDQTVVFWDAPGGPAREVISGLGRLPEVPRDAEALTSYERWLDPLSARLVGERVAALRERGEAFADTVRTVTGRYLDAEGRCTADAAILRFRDMSAIRMEAARLSDALSRLGREAEAMRIALAEMSHPVWLYDTSGRVVWANAGYLRAVDATDLAAVTANNIEFLDGSARAAAAEALTRGEVWRRRITAVVAGQRRTLDVQVTPFAEGAVGIATDVSDVEAGRRDLERLVAAHQRTLDNLATPVAIFGADRRLAYHNTAWRELWSLDPVFLADTPEEGVILDRLRLERRLPEQADYKDWKAQHLAVYHASEPRESFWHLPDGRTLRVTVLPNPQGGITLVQENLTEVLDLKARNQASQRVQRETLDALSDAVAVFGSDGRLKLSNPALVAMWRLEGPVLSLAPHIDQVLTWLGAMHDDPSLWSRLKSTASATGEDRRPMGARIERRDGTILELAAVPLPDGATLVTFVDVTASVNVERALTERNDALEASARLKSAFVQHVSYELRSPLTNIMGFSELLAGPGIGVLNEKQREYLGYILSASGTLLTIIDMILDLATIDAGVMQLDLTRVDVAGAMEAAADGVRDRLVAEGITLDMAPPAELGAFTADAKRVRQVLYQLLSNAVGFSERGQSVRFRAERGQAGEVHFIVSDKGRGMEAGQAARAFDRFETRTAGTRHRGVGLGLSIVKSFVELHGGRVQLTSEPGSGTTVTCVFPQVAMERPSSGLAA